MALFCLGQIKPNEALGDRTGGGTWNDLNICCYDGQIILIIGHQYIKCVLYMIEIINNIIKIF